MFIKLVVTMLIRITPHMPQLPNYLGSYVENISKQLKFHLTLSTPFFAIPNIMSQGGDYVNGIKMPIMYNPNLATNLNIVSVFTDNARLHISHWKA